MTAIIVLILRVLMAASLYLFLGWALWTVWRDLQMQSQVLASRRVPPITLKLEEGADERSITFDKAEITVGRDPSSDFSIDDETASSQHARLTYHHNQWWVEDLHSTNGTFLNDERVFTQTVLISGDELRVGKVFVIVKFG